MRNRYEMQNRFVNEREAMATRARLSRRHSTFNIADEVYDLEWAKQHKESQAPNSYFDYFFAGPDIKAYIAELADDPEFGDMPIHGIAFNIEQQKTPVYGYWSYCVDVETEALTQRGWVNGLELTEDDIILSMDPADQQLKWSTVRSIYRNFDYDADMHYVTNKNMDALVTPGHKFALNTGELKPVEELRKQDRIVTMGTSLENDSEIYTDAFVELMGWFVTEGHIRKNAIEITQSKRVNPEYCERIEFCLKRLGIEYSSWVRESSEVIKYYIGLKKNPILTEIIRHAPNRALSYEFITALSQAQRELLIDTMIDGDGSRSGINGRQYVQKDVAHIDSFVALCALSGISTHISAPRNDCYTITLKNRRVNEGYSLDFHGGYRGGRYNTRIHSTNPNKHQPTIPYKGLVWCPETEYGTFVCRRKGKVYVTGNTYDAVMRGTRLVSGQFTLITKYPGYMREALSAAAANRSANRNNLSDDYPAPGAWRKDDENIERYWGKHIDDAARVQGKNEWSIHPPFSFVIVYGVQNTSVQPKNLGQSYAKYESDNALMSDQNQRLVESYNGEKPSRLIIDGCELVSCNRSFTSDLLVAESYSFFGRDIIVPPAARTNRNRGGGGGGGVSQVQ